jgi:DNA-binding NarL/FixJ family response regulator
VSGGDGPRVLLVDDDTRFRTSTRLMLEQNGFVIVGEVASGELGSILAEAILPDVVLMDYRMPGGDGIAATKAIRGRLPRTQVVMLSAYDDAEIKREATAAGIFAYLTKGSEPQLISTAVRDAWERKRALEELASVQAGADALPDGGADDGDTEIDEPGGPHAAAGD